MNTEEEMFLRGGGIVIYFQGAHINNLVINENVGKDGSAMGMKSNGDMELKREVDYQDVGRALAECGGFFWGYAAIATIFCVCRDYYNFPDNAAQFERQMGMMKIECPKGIIANTMRNNPYMKFPVQKWAEHGAQQRVMKLVEEFTSCVKDVVNSEEPLKKTS